MLVYYPKSSFMFLRDTTTASYEQLAVAAGPNTVLYLDTGSVMNAISASLIYITASNAVTASYTISASYAANGGVSGGGINGMTLFTGSTLNAGYTTTWTVPAGISKVRAICIGGGGGGGTGNPFSPPDPTTVGFVGGYAEGIVSVTPLSNVVVIVGSGGRPGPIPTDAYVPVGSGSWTAIGDITASGGTGGTTRLGVVGITGSVGSGGIFNYTSSMAHSSSLSASNGYTNLPLSLQTAGIGGNMEGGTATVNGSGSAGCVLLYY